MMYGNRWFNGPNLFLLFFGVFTYWVFYRQGNGGSDTATRYILLALLLINLFTITNTSFYFVIDAEQITVKNYFKPWYKSAFRFDEIGQVGVETMPLANGRKLIITTKDEAKHVIWSKILHKTSWKAMIADINTHGFNAD